MTPREAQRQKIRQQEKAMAELGKRPTLLQPKPAANWARLAWGLPTYRALGAWE